MQIIPSILVQSEEEFIEQITNVQDSVKQVQLDIADNKFVPNTTWANPEIVKQYTKINVELHLMVADPLEELKKWEGIEQIKRVLVHYESVDDFEVVLTALKDKDWQVGVVINPDTELEAIEPFLEKVQSVMFMGVHPGKQGQELIPEVLERIQELTISHPDVFTEIDGGVNESTLPQIIQSGVRAICPGSAIFKNTLPAAESVKQMEESINKLSR